ncbi:hypothetical protein BDW59DRAFT_164205 [Aspergillus cavernicola]|uniref:Transferase family-domain-containing protein n=1 Tax=Aspergillus cavernicola TaxID=176166 RepID=A0ABR4I2V0_9EURO
MAPSSNPQKYHCRSALSLPFKVNIGLVVDGVLDASILREKYAQLIELWPLLGGTLLSTFDPRKFQCGSTVDFESRTVAKDLASFLPFSWSGGAHPNPRILNDDPTGDDEKFLFHASVNPASTSKLRVTILDNGTLLGFGFSHSLCDGQSGYDIINYFCKLLSGQQIPKSVLPPDALGARISDLVREETTEPIPAQPEEGGFVTNHLRALKFHGIYLLMRVKELLGLAPKLTHKLVHLPGAWVDELRMRAQKELEGSSDYSGSAIQLTRNDLITALYLKMVYGAKKPSTSNSPVDFIGPINYRGLLQPPEDGTFYPHNSIIFLICQLSERELQTHSIAAIAARIRLSTIQYRHPEVIKRQIRLLEDKVLAPAMQDLRGGVKWGTAMVSPWTTFNYLSLDFSGASREGRKASVVFVTPNTPLSLGVLPSPFTITLKDGAGGYWLRGANTQRGWEAFDRITMMDSLFAST